MYTRDSFGVTELVKALGDEENAHSIAENKVLEIHETTADVPRATSIRSEHVGVDGSKGFVRQKLS